jgi:RNA polymerase sigma factor (TIGR02999 family)
MSSKLLRPWGESVAAAEPGDVTRLLTAWRQGDASAGECLIPLIYGELRRLAASYLRHERGDHTLQPTALVHEAFLRLVGQRDLQWQNRAHFFGLAAQLMRRILVDHARTHATAKRGGGKHALPLGESIALSDEQSDDVVAVDQALSRLAKFDPRQSRIVELRFFGGLTEAETAEVLGISTRTIKRDWAVAKAWLYGELNK